MLGKLLKDEIKSYCFPMGIAFLSGVVFTIFMKIMCMIPYDSNVKEVIQILIAYGYYYIILLIVTAAQVLVIIRFYKTMVADRGYLTWTLPVKSSTHIWAKLIGGSIWRLIATIVTGILLFVFYIGNYWDIDLAGMLKDINWAMSEMIRNFKFEYLPAVFFAIVAVILWSVSSVLMLYMCIAIGQLFGKWRLIASIGTYFLIMMIIYALMIAGVVFMSVGAFPFIDQIDAMIGDIELNATLVMTGVIAIFAAVGGGLDALFFGITNHIFKNHLNLE